MSTKNKMSSKDTMKSLTFKGKDYKYNSIFELSKKLHITMAQARNISANPKQTRILKNANGTIETYTLDQPFDPKIFGVKSITNQKYASTNAFINKSRVSISDTVDKKSKIKAHVNFTFTVSEEEQKSRWMDIPINLANTNNIEDYIYEYLYNYIYEFAPDAAASLVILHHDLITPLKGNPIPQSAIKMRAVKPMQLTLFNDIIDTKTYYDCVRDYCKAIWCKPSKKSRGSKLSPKVIDSLGDDDGVSTNEVLEFCEERNIKMIAYDQQRNVIAANYPSKKNRKFKALIYISAFGHMYPVKKALLHSVKPVFNEIILKSDLSKELIKLLEKDIKPADIKIKGFKKDKSSVDIASYVLDKKLYVDNPEYEQCKTILEAFGLADHMYPSIRLSRLCSIIEKPYKTGYNSVESFLPEHQRFIKGGYNYVGKYDETKQIDTIDNNKHYMHALMTLMYLIRVDWRTAKITRTPTEIIDHYLYIATPETSNILMPDMNLYSGYHLRYCEEEGINFEINEGIETIKVDNWMSNMVRDILEKVDNDLAKHILVRWIGSMEEANKTKTYSECDDVYLQNEVFSRDGFAVSLTEKYAINLIDKE